MDGRFRRKAPGPPVVPLRARLRRKLPDCAGQCGKDVAKLPELAFPRLNPAPARPRDEGVRVGWPRLHAPAPRTRPSGSGSASSSVSSGSSSGASGRRRSAAVASRGRRRSRRCRRRDVWPLSDRRQFPLPRWGESGTLLQGGDPPHSAGRPVGAPKSARLRSPGGWHQTCCSSAASKKREVLKGERCQVASSYRYSWSRSPCRRGRISRTVGAPTSAATTPPLCVSGCPLAQQGDEIAQHNIGTFTVVVECWK